MMPAPVDGTVVVESRPPIMSESIFITGQSYLEGGQFDLLSIQLTITYPVVPMFRPFTSNHSVFQRHRLTSIGGCLTIRPKLQCGQFSLRGELRDDEASMRTAIMSTLACESVKGKQRWKSNLEAYPIRSDPCG